MNEAQLYEKIGRLQTAIDDRAAQYDRLLDVLAKVVSGEIETSRVIVNLTDKTWGYSEAGTRPGTPPQINGVPVVVVAPEPPADMRVGPFRDGDREVFVMGPGLTVIAVDGPTEPKPE